MASNGEANRGNDDHVAPRLIPWPSYPSSPTAWLLRWRDGGWHVSNLNIILKRHAAMYEAHSFCLCLHRPCDLVLVLACVGHIPLRP